MEVKYDTRVGVIEARNEDTGKREYESRQLMELKEIKKRYDPKLVKGTVKPKFRDPSTLSSEQLTDPDYRLKQLQKLNDELGGNKLNITCSRCHHCR